MSLAIGLDLGGTKLEVIAIDAQGRELLRRRRATPRAYDATIEAIAEMVAQIEHALGGTATIGIGHPGAISPATGRIKNANSTWLNGRRFDHDVMARLGRPVALANDANCLALSEATDGAGAGAAVVFAVIIGTGCGGGIAVHGRILTGPNAIAGEWGHNPLPWANDAERPGPACYCGKHGCLETWISGPALAADYRRVSGEELGTHALVEQAENGDLAAAASLARYTDRLARGLASIINVLDPDVIVLGGGMSNIASLYAELPERLPCYVFSDSVRTRIVQAVHGDSSGVRGAAWLGRGLILT